ncbi:hypothetical protein DRN67_02340, partial [Candidatus Micrarchaeota archaeon]
MAQIGTRVGAGPDSKMPTGKFTGIEAAGAQKLAIDRKTLDVLLQVYEGRGRITLMDIVDRALGIDRIIELEAKDSEIRAKAIKSGRFQEERSFVNSLVENGMIKFSGQQLELTEMGWEVLASNVESIRKELEARAECEAILKNIKNISEQERAFLVRLFQELRPEELIFSSRIAEESWGSKAKRAGTVLSLGAWTDVKHSLLLKADRYIFIDHGYASEKGLNTDAIFKIIDEVRRLTGTSPMSLQEIKGSVSTLKFKIAGRPVEIVLVAGDALEMKWSEIPGLGREKASAVMVKKPCEGLYAIREKENVEKIAGVLKNNGLLLEVGVAGTEEI